MDEVRVAACGAIGLGIVVLVVPLALSMTVGFTQAEGGSFRGSAEDCGIPRLGGATLGLAFLVVVAFITTSYQEPWVWDADEWLLLVGPLAMCALGVWHDIQPQRATYRLCGQCVIALVVCCFSLSWPLSLLPFSMSAVDVNGWGIALTVAWLVGMTNLVAVLDTVEGAAGGMCWILMTLFVGLGRPHGRVEQLAAGMAGALIGFLCFNFPPAQIRLGRGGSYFLGFQIALVALLVSRDAPLLAGCKGPELTRVERVDTSGIWARGIWNSESSCSGVAQTSGLPVQGASGSLTLAGPAVRARGSANGQARGLPHARS